MIAVFQILLIIAALVVLLLIVNAVIGALRDLAGGVSSGLHGVGHYFIPSEALSGVGPEVQGMANAVADMAFWQALTHPFDTLSEFFSGGN